MQRNYYSAAVCIFSIAILNLFFAFPTSLAQMPDVLGNDLLVEDDNLTELNDLSEKFQIQIAFRDLAFPVKTIHGLIEGKAAELKTLRKYQKLFASEMSRYPVSLVKNAKLVRIVLCEELVFDGQRRNAIPDFEHDVLYLDVKRGDYNQQYQRKVIHHEFFHLIDYKDDGNVYSDASWAALNPATFRYGTGGRNAQDDATTSILTDRFPGFLNHYSTTGVEEDKAEMFANLIVVPQHVQTRALADAVIKAKVEKMKSLMQKFCPEIKDDFWQKTK